jgi:hypothetical protein
MQRVEADFNRMGYTAENSIELGTEERLAERGISLREGEQILVVEPGELEAVGVAERVRDVGWGKWFWRAMLDMSTLRQLDVQEATGQ